MWGNFFSSKNPPLKTILKHYKQKHQVKAVHLRIESIRICILIFLLPLKKKCGLHTQIHEAMFPKLACCSPAFKLFHITRSSDFISPTPLLWRATLNLWTLSVAVSHNGAGFVEVPSTGNTRFQENSHADGLMAFKAS